MANTEGLKLDEMDLAILSHLEDNGRKTFSEIAADLDVTVSTISTRVKRLIDRRVLTILGFLVPSKIGFTAPATIFIDAQPGHVEEVAEAISELPEVSWVALFTGDFDVLAEILCRDMNHLTELLTHQINQIEGVADTRVSLHLRRIKMKQPSVGLLESRGPAR